MFSIGVNLTSIPDECRQIFNVSLFSCPEVKRIECAGPWDAAVFFIIILFIAGLVFLFIFYSTRIGQNKTLETSDVTYCPVQPGWLRGLQSRVRFSGNIRIECVKYNKEYNGDTLLSSEKKQGAILWIRNILKTASIPDAARLISVPMANFKTGRSCTEFIPLTGMAAGSFLTFQICGDHSFQVTRYVEDGVAYVAGYCMYISSPYASSSRFAYHHIKKCNEAPKYKSRGWAQQRDALLRPEAFFIAPKKESETIDMLENLKLTFCKVLNEPVMIGLDNGVVKHFKWHGSPNCFMVTECSSCCLTILEENPPSYQSLHVSRCAIES